MNGRERLTAIMHRRPPDRLAWTTLVDQATLRHLPPALQGNGGLDFYRHIGCDILLLNGWGLPHPFRSPQLRWGAEVQETVRKSDGCAICEWRTPRGALTGIIEGGHPVKYPVDSLEAVRLFRAMWEGAQFAGADDRPAYEAIAGAVGDDGLVTRFWGPSAIPRLLEADMGTANFYYLLEDYPADMDALIRTLHERELAAFAALAQGPCKVVILCENTSTYYISPDLYRRYNGPQVADFVRIVQAAGKIALIHMCGHVKNILADIRRTGLDGVHMLTPAPTGDTPWELALDTLGEEQIIIGLLDASTFLLEPLDRLGPALDALYTPRLRRAHFILALGADGIAVPLERFEAVAQWMAENGAL
jgi:hypothetical protein